MSEHSIRREIWLPAPRQEVFAFFSEARNLEAITPAILRFEVVTPEPIEMREGALIAYKLRIHGFPVRWLTRITKWNPPYEFADVQLKGPYKKWDHTHRFIEENGGTRMIDEVHYSLPLGWLGDIVHAVKVRSDVKNIFTHRNAVIADLFPTSSPAGTPRGQ